MTLDIFIIAFIGSLIVWLIGFGLQVWKDDYIPDAFCLYWIAVLAVASLMLAFRISDLVRHA